MSRDKLREPIHFLPSLSSYESNPGKYGSETKGTLI